MRHVGRTTIGALTFPLEADSKRGARFTLDEGPAIAPKMTVYVDGLGPGAAVAPPGAAQPARAVIYAVTGSEVGVSVEVPIPAGMAPRWVDFSFAPGIGVALAELQAAGDYDLALHTGQPGEIARVYGDDPSPQGGRISGDTYAGGPSGTFGFATPLTADMSAFCPLEKPWAAPEGETEEFYARLPFAAAQGVLGAAGGVVPAATAADCGWHGTRFDRERGSFAIVDKDGPLSDLVGQRLRLRPRFDRHAKPVTVFVKSDARVAAGDVTVPRRAFMPLGPLSKTTVQVWVEVLG